MRWLILILLALHTALTGLVVLLSRAGALKVRAAMYPMVALAPLFGPLCAGMLSWHKRHNTGETDLQLDRFQVESSIYQMLDFPTGGPRTQVAPLQDVLKLNDAASRRSLMQELMRDSVVPLEEALILSSSDVRRKLMMDVLSSNAGAFYSLLEQARLNDDVEVVHYATTAMSQLGAQYDKMLEKCNLCCQRDPDNLDALRLYCDTLQEYLAMGIARGRMLELRRETCLQLLRRLLEREPTLENHLALARQQMDAGDLAGAAATAAEMEERWPADDRVWQTRLELLCRQGDGAAVARMVVEALRSGVYFKRETREILEFWSKGAAG